MPPEKNGTEVIEKAESEEVQDGVENADGAEDQDAGLGAEDGSHQDGTGEAERSENRTAEDSGESEEAGQDVQPEPSVEDRLAALEEENRQLKEQAAHPKEERKEEAKPLPQRTSEEWQALSEATEIPVKALQYQERMQIDFAQRIVGFVKKSLEDRFGGIERDRTLGSLSSKFKDIQNYKTGIDEYLKNYAVKDHSNPVLLEQAYWYARGKASDSKVKKVIQSKELNRKVVKRVGLQKTNGAKVKGSGDYRLSPAEESAWSSFGQHHFKDKDEYARSLPRNRGK